MNCVAKAMGLVSKRPWTFHAYSVWLFTRSDLKTIIIPSTIFGILNGIAISLDTQSTLESHWTQVLFRLPHVVFWLWINLLPFNIDNQRQDKSILEDKLNKPWRTLPSGRMTPTEAKTLMFCFYPLALYASLYIGGVKQCIALMLLGFGYNDLNLGDLSWFTRNVINALGFCCFTSGALEVTLSTHLQFPFAEHDRMLKWLGLIAAVVFSTIQTQDMADQYGDRLRNRKTMPLELGDEITRWVTAALMVAWSLFCPTFWRLNVASILVFRTVGIIVAFRTILYGSVVSDQRTFVIWNIWMGLLYSLPLLAAIT